jgi:hypothetical protein
MRSVFFMLLMAVCTSCTNKPIAPNVLCESITPCTERTVATNKHRQGLPARLTVQTALMLLKPTLINGLPAEPGDWPASVYAKMGDAACSATIVGERVLLMASHCMSEGAKVSFTAHANNYTARCNHHPEYRRNSTADWALCLIDRPVTGVPFEVLGVNEKLTIGETVTLTGYGCIRPGGGGGNDGIFRIGDATVQGLPSGSTYDVVTKGGGALCFGDSGGSAYRLHDDGNRFIFGVNSRGDIQTMSYLPSVASKSFVSWAQSWAKTNNNVKICGLHDDAASCRNAPIADKDGKFELSAPEVGCIRGNLAPKQLDRKNEIVEDLQKTMSKYY